MVRMSARTKPPPAGGKNLPPGEPADHALGRSRGGFGTKLHLISDGHGLPLAIQASAGQAHESCYVRPLLQHVRIPQPCGRPRSRPRFLAGDKGYSYAPVRRWLHAHHIRAVIPRRSDQLHRRGRPVQFDRAAYRRRSVIECCMGWLKERRRVATRFEKLALHFLGVLKIAMIEKHLNAALSDRP